MPYYTLSQKNEPEGPFSIEQIRSSLNNGALTAESLVCKEGGIEWVRLGSIISLSNQKYEATQLTNASLKYFSGTVGFIFGVISTLSAIYIYNNSSGEFFKLKHKNQVPTQSTEGSASEKPASTQPVSLPFNKNEPKYIARVLERSGGIDGVRVILLFKDTNDDDTSATGKVVVRLYEKDSIDPFVSEEFNISEADFKKQEYGLWEAYMITLPRLVYPENYRVNSTYGKAEVTFTSAEGSELKGEGRDMKLKP